MNIENCESFLNVDNYRAFSKMLAGPGYYPFIRSYEFDFSGEQIFTKEQLLEIIPSRPLTGTMQACSFSVIQKKITDALQWDSNYLGVLSRIENQELIKARTLLFFDGIPLDFVYEKVQKCFIYEPGIEDYFADTTLWSFCFVLLSSDNKGLLFYGKTWSSGAACKPETDDEARWRKNYSEL